MEQNGTEQHLEAPARDELLDCMVVMTHMLGRPASRYALMAGLPLVEGRLTPELFIRATQKINIGSKIVQSPLHALSNTILPVVLILKDQGACILTEIDTSANKATVVIPQATKSEETLTPRKESLPLNQLNLIYSGQLLLIQPHYQFTHGDKKEEAQIKQNTDWFWGEIRKAWPIYSEIIVAALLINLFALGSPLFVMNIYDRVVPNNAMETLWVLTIGMLIVFGFDLLMRILRGYFIDIAAKKIDLNLSSKIFAQIIGIKMGDRPNSVGALANTIQSFESFRDFITSSTITVLIDLPFALIFILAILYVGGILALVPALLLPLTMLLGYIFQKQLTEAIKKSYQHAAEKQATLFETLGNIETIKTTFSEGAMQRKWEQLMAATTDINIKVKFISNSNLSVAMLLQQLTTVVIVLMGVYQIKNGELTVGALIACTILAGRAISVATQATMLLTRYQQMTTAMHSLHDIMKLPTEHTKDKPLLYHSPLKGSVEFRNVKFSYPNQNIDSLHNVSFRLNAGERVGIIGRIGSGKSTIAKLILGLYAPTDGNILLDDTEIQQYDLADIRCHIGYVPQDISLFHGSIYSNIVFGAPYVQAEKVHEAVRITGLDEVIKYHPQGLDVEVGEGGRYLSGGQRQLVAIARAILLDPSLLIFDEPTNSMDERTEHQFIEKFSHYIQNKTLILMTHKASLISLVNYLIVVDSGRVVASGPRDMIIKALAKGIVATPSG